MSKRLILISFPIILLAGIYFIGPEPDRPEWDSAKISVPVDPDALERHIADQNSMHRLKPDNEARIVWADSSRKKTEYSVVYIHGFSASQEEGDPVHEEFAKKFGCNLYLARMADHGIDTTEQLLYFTADRWWKSSREALAIGRALGDKVIIMSTSTGGSMALALAAEYPTEVFALMNMSPLIALNDPLAWLGPTPWGLQIGRLVKGRYLAPSMTPGTDTTLFYRYWNRTYRLEAGIQLTEMVNSKMNKETFEKIVAPSLTLYYFKNEQEQDQTVKVSAILEMHKQLGTADSLKVAIPIPNAGDHVLGSHVVSKDIESVNRAVMQFAIEKLHMKPVADKIR